MSSLYTALYTALSITGTRGVGGGGGGEGRKGRPFHNSFKLQVKSLPVRHKKYMIL